MSDWSAAESHVHHSRRLIESCEKAKVAAWRLAFWAPARQELVRMAAEFGAIAAERRAALLHTPSEEEAA